MGAVYENLNPFLQSVNSLANQKNFIPPSVDPTTFGYEVTNIFQAPDPVQQQVQFDTSGVPATWSGLSGGTGFIGGNQNNLGRILILNSSNAVVGTISGPEAVGATYQLSVFTTTGYIYAQRFVDVANTAFFVDPAASGTSINVAGVITAVGKVNAAAFDPIYEIGGKQYATYAPGMVGLKEELSFLVRVTKDKDAVIDFTDLEEGSDLWLFNSITTVGRELENLVVLLTPGGVGYVHYRKEGKTLIIHADTLQTQMEVSVRLTAPRFDHNAYPTETEGYATPLKPYL